MRPAALVLCAALAAGCAHGGAAKVDARPMPPVASLPVCGFEAPYLPEPCRMQVAPGEWLAVRNPKPQETKPHSRWWWLLMALVAL